MDNARHRLIRRKNFLMLCLSALLLSGCMGNAVKQETSAAQSDFYNGKAALPFLAQQQANSVEEAMARASAALQNNDSDRALFNFIRAYELDEQYTDALLGIADVHFQRGNLTISQKAFERALAVNSDLGRAHQGLGLIHLHRKAYGIAEKALKQSIILLLRDDPKNPRLVDTYNSLGIISDLHSDFALAMLYYQEAEQLAPGNPVITNNLGYSFYMQEQWQQAEAAFNRALQSDSAYAPAWRNLGLTYARQQRYDDALNALEQTMAQHQAYNDIGYICMISGEYEDAARFFRKAIDTNPRYYQVAQQNLTRVKRLLASNPNTRSEL